MNLRGTKLVYDANKKSLTCNGVTAPVEAPAGAFLMQIFVDRGSVEVFASNGRVAMSVAALPDEKNRKVEFTGRAHSGSVWHLKSAWGK